MLILKFANEIVETKVNVVYVDDEMNGTKDRALGDTTSDLHPLRCHAIYYNPNFFCKASA